MKLNSRMLTLASGLMLFAAVPFGQAADPAESGWIKVFNGKDLSDWNTYKITTWRVEDGVLVGETDEKSPATRIRTRPLAVEDAIIEFEVRFTGDVDAAVLSRKGGLKLWLGTSGQEKVDRTGSWYSGKAFVEKGLAKDIDKLWKKDAWNTIRFMAKGDTFTTWINGQQVSEFTDPSYPLKNHIELHTHAGKKMKIEIRNFRAKELK